MIPFRQLIVFLLLGAAPLWIQAQNNDLTRYRIPSIKDIFLPPDESENLLPPTELSYWNYSYYPGYVWPMTSSDSEDWSSMTSGYWNLTHPKMGTMWAKLKTRIIHLNGNDEHIIQIVYPGPWVFSHLLDWSFWPTAHTYICFYKGNTLIFGATTIDKNSLETEDQGSNDELSDVFKLPVPDYSGAWAFSNLHGWIWAYEPLFPWVYQLQNGWTYIASYGETIWTYQANTAHWSQIR